jgi:pilus assembly protein Flp/PilA
MIKLLKKLRDDDCGATAIEYGLIAGIISLAIIAGATQIGGSVKTTFGTVANNISK